MRLTGIRALLLVLAMVVQTVAGGVGLARATSISLTETISGPCHQLRAGEQPAPDDRLGHRHNCQCCLSCGEPPPAWISQNADYLVAVGEYALTDTRVRAESPLSVRPWRAHCARAPPVSRA